MKNHVNFFLVRSCGNKLISSLSVALNDKFIKYIINCLFQYYALIIVIQSTYIIANNRFYN